MILKPQSLLWAAFTFTALLLSGEVAHAVKQAIQIISPASAHELGFSVKVNRLESGELEFRISRDLTRARVFPPDSELRTRRSATLKVFGNDGLLVSCEVAPTEKDNMLTYRFVVDPKHTANSHLTVAEIDDYKDAGREHLIGGGTYYKITLGSFTETDK